MPIVTLADDPGLGPQMEALIGRAWPRYVVEGHDARLDGMSVHWPGIYERWPQYQFALLEEGFDAILASGNCLPLAWDGDVEDLPDTGWTWAMHSGALDLAEGRRARTLCALAITIQPELQGSGLSARMVEGMTSLGRAVGFTRLVAPVRPSHKSRYPLASFDDYLAWTTTEGLPFDPWLRVHVRLGGRVVKACYRSSGFTGSVREWEGWSGLRFPVSGAYAVQDCLSPLEIDLEQDQGLYIEPNVWVLHDLQKEPPN